MTNTANTPPPIAEHDLFIRAAEHATKALPPHTGTWLASQFHAAAETLSTEFAQYATGHLGTLTNMAWEILAFPLRPDDEDDRVQKVAKALWEKDFPPERHMSWGRINQQDPKFVRRYLDLAKAALLAADQSDTATEQHRVVVEDLLDAWCADGACDHPGECVQRPIQVCAECTERNRRAAGDEAPVVLAKDCRRVPRTALESQPQ